MEIWVTVKSDSDGVAPNLKSERLIPRGNPTFRRMGSWTPLDLKPTFLKFAAFGGKDHQISLA